MSPAPSVPHEPRTAPEQPHGPRPVALLIASVACALEVLALLTGAVALVVEVVRGRSDTVGGSLGLALIALVLAAALTLGVRSLLAGGRRGRGPVVTWQLLQGLVAFSLWRTGAGTWALVVLVASLVVVVLLVLPSVGAFTAARGAARPGTPTR